MVMVVVIFIFMLMLMVVLMIVFMIMVMSMVMLMPIAQDSPTKNQKDEEDQLNVFHNFYIFKYLTFEQWRIYILIMEDDNDKLKQRYNRFKSSNQQSNYREDASRSRDNQRGRYNNNRGDDRWRNNRNQNRNSHNGYNHHQNQYLDEAVVRKVFQVEVDAPKQFLLAENIVCAANNRFKIHLELKGEPPIAPTTRLGDLKAKITPIEQLWTSHIKQYLNDSEFVEIYRRRNSLAHGEIKYGNSIINYEEGARKEMVYQNQTKQSDIFSRAYFKLWEILSLGVLQSKKDEDIRIACVAQGPGGFIHALIDFRLKDKRSSDSFSAITLKIGEGTRNAKDWSDPRGKSFFDGMRSMGYKIRLSYGQTNNGDLLKQVNLDAFAQHDLENKKCWLVTGDGGIECIGDRQFEYQQVFNAKLFFAEILAALKVNEIGGSFILKIYDCSFQLTKQLIVLLAMFYHKVRIVKPVTSRPGNSQKYLLMEGYRGITAEQQQTLKQLLKQWTTAELSLSYFQNTQFAHSILSFPNVDVSTIMSSLVAANNFFIAEQQQKLEQGLRLSQSLENDVKKVEAKLKEIRYSEQISYAYAWCKKYGLTTIECELQKKIQP